MFLSRVELPWEAVRNPYDLHRHVWRLFPGETRESRASGEAERQGFLFRVEHNPTGHPARLLVQSRRAPVVVAGIALVGTREFHPRPVASQRLAFLLTANPVKTITDAERDAKPGKKSEKCRVPLIRENDQREWLLRKLAVGAEVESTDVLLHPPLYFRKGNRGGKLVTATFEGVLRVRDPNSLATLLENGIGHAKAFGCGLLLVRRI
ncbi:MAG: type I-E CRISPR-associated protein Cas6/Cse3/CasE [Burkholderiales bacterium]